MDREEGEGMKPLSVDVALLVAHTGASHLIPEDRCRLFDAVPTLILLGKAGWASEDDWRRALGFSPDGWAEFGRASYAPVLEQPEGWGLRPVAEAVEARKTISEKRAVAGRCGGRGKQNKANAKQKKASARQMLSFATSGGGATDCAVASPAVEKGFTSSIDSKDSQDSGVELFLLGGAGGGWKPTVGQVEAWRTAYPSVDLGEEFAKMRAWQASNPSRGKTDRGLPRFVNSWLSRAVPRPSVAAAHADLGSVWGLTPKRGVNRG
jgi:hypothetical protein